MPSAPSRRAVLTGAAAGMAAASLRSAAPGLADAGSEYGSSAAYSGPGLTPTAVGPLPTGDDALLHLLRRVTHGPAPVDWELIAALGPSQYLEDQLADRPDRLTDMAVQSRFPYAETTPATTYAALGPSFSGTAMRHVALAHTFRQLVSTRQLFEQVVDVLFNRLNIPANGDNAPWSLPDYYAQVIRKNAYGKYADMVLASVTHGAMLDYLSASKSTKAHPNENLGRELLELHTVGLDARYTESHVKQAGLALTGLTTNADGSATYKAANHYTGKLRVLGWSHDNADPAAGRDVVASLVAYLVRQPTTARRIALTLATRFVSDRPPADLLDAMQRAYLDNDTAIVPVLRTMFAHKAFAASVGAKARRPHQQALAVARALLVGPDLAQSAGSDGTTKLWFAMGYLADAPLTHAAPDGHPDINAFWLSSSTRLAAPKWVVSAVAGWGAGLTKPSPVDLRPTDPHATGGEVWLPTTMLTPRQVVAACARRMLGVTLPDAQLDLVAKGAAIDPTGPAASLAAYDGALPAVYALLAAHPLHTVR